MIKQCFKCKRTLLLCEFNKNKHNNDGLQNCCKDCMKKYNKKYNLTRQKYSHKFIRRKTVFCLNGIRTQIYYNLNTNSITIRDEFKKKYDLGRKKIMTNLKINGCAICGYNKCERALEFHHTNPQDKNFYIRRETMFYPTLTEEVNKCILLCANCHREVHNANKE